MIDYPEDERLREQAKQHDLQAPVLIRNIVRVVEVLNLRAQRFFNSEAFYPARWRCAASAAPASPSTTPTSQPPRRPSTRQRR
jgi:hypothetical protein